MTEERTPIAYVEHPCTKAEKLSHKKKGFKVVDARFRPADLEKGDKVFMKPKAEEKPKAPAGE